MFLYKLLFKKRKKIKVRDEDVKELELLLGKRKKQSDDLVNTEKRNLINTANKDINIRIDTSTNKLINIRKLLRGAIDITIDIVFISTVLYAVYYMSIINGFENEFLTMIGQTIESFFNLIVSYIRNH